MSDNIEMTEIIDHEIIHNLIENKYDIKQLETKFIIYCMLVIFIQIDIFERIFNGDDITKISYYNENEFKNNENDLLQIGKTVKILYPILCNLKIEINENRKINLEIIQPIYHECLEEYKIKNFK